MRQRKVSDLHNRASFVNGIPNAVLLSIHQNSLPSSPVTHGAQTFWNRQEGAEALARTLQAGLNPVVNTHRAKEPKQIPDSIYLMNHVDRSRSAGGVRLSVQQGGGRAAPAGGLSDKRWRRSSRRGICDGWPERIGNESKNAVLLYGMWKRDRQNGRGSAPPAARGIPLWSSRSAPRATGKGASVRVGMTRRRACPVTELHG